MKKMMQPHAGSFVKKLKCRTAIVALFTVVAFNAQAQVCEQLFAEKPARLSLAQETEQLRERVGAFLESHGNAQLVQNVSTEFAVEKINAKMQGNSDVVVISLNGLTPAQRVLLRQQTLDAMGKNSISMPLKEGESHLATRIGETLYDYDYRWSNLPGGDKPDGWITNLFQHRYELPTRSYQDRADLNVLEPVIAFSGEEMERVQTYITSAKKDIVATAGRFSMDGTVFNSGNLTSNVPPKGTGNNCTSWLMNAPVGVDQRSMLNLLGRSSPYRGYIATNPGWLLAYIMTSAAPERVPVRILWTPLPLADAVTKLQATGLAGWNFNPH